MKSASEWVDELGSGLWASDVEKIQRDAWESGARAEQKAIVDEVWGSWAQAGCESAPIVKFPEATNAPK